MKKLLVKAEELIVDKPESHWKFDKVKGKQRETLARLCGVFKTGLKVAELLALLQDLDLMEDSIKGRIDTLKRSIEEKEAEITPLVAKRRETEGFLADTLEFADDVDDDDKDEDEEDDEDEDDESDMDGQPGDNAVVDQK